MTDKSVVPEGMVAWAGGQKPQDWSGEGVQFRDGMIMRSGPGTIWNLGWDHRYGNGDIIAYTQKSNPLNLETSDLDPITPEELVIATEVLGGLKWTRQIENTVVRCIRAGLAKAGAVIVPVEPTDAMVRAGSAAIEDIDQENVNDNDTRFWGQPWRPCTVGAWFAMLSAHSIQSGGEGGEG